MKINTGGTTRLVLEFKNFVVKLPNFTHSWFNFIQGIVCNINENQTYKFNLDKQYLLAPVLWCSWGGWILIMKKADVKRHLEEVINSPKLNLDPELEVLQRYSKWINQSLGGDDKCDNYGYIDNILVKIDYGS